MIPPSGQVSGDLAVEWTGGSPSGTPYVILGEPGSSRLEAKQLTARAGVSLSAGTGRSEGDFKIGGGVRGGKVVVSLGDADGFIGTLVGGGGLESDFDLDLGFSTKDGLFFQGSATLVIQLPLHVTIGPIDVTALTLSAGLDGAAVPVTAAADIKGELGPLKAVVEKVGFRLV